MTSVSTVLADVPIAPTPDLHLVLESAADTARGGAPVALVWAGVACTAMWIGALCFATYLGGTAVVHRLFG